MRIPQKGSGISGSNRIKSTSHNRSCQNKCSENMACTYQQKGITTIPRILQLLSKKDFRSCLIPFNFWLARMTGTGQTPSKMPLKDSIPNYQMDQYWLYPTIQILTGSTQMPLYWQVELF
jgi:hypothetical protein